jgi:hypothetical protein
MFAISSTVMSRRAWVLLARNSCHCSHVIPDALDADALLIGTGRAPRPMRRRSNWANWPRDFHSSLASCTDLRG